MNHPLFWFVDEEWKDYKIEVNVLQQQYPDCELRFSSYGYERDLEKFGYRADAITAQVCAQIPASVVQRLENCGGITVLGGGYDRINTGAARARGIGVMNVQGYCTEDLADYILVAILHFYKSLTFYRDSLKNGEWGAQAVARVPRRVSHSTLFMIGCGGIDSTMAKHCQSLGMRVTAYDPSQDDEMLRKLNTEPVTMEKGLRQAGYASLNIKLDENTTNLIDEREFSFMKPTTYFINTTHGAIMKEEELIKTLGNYVIAGAAVGVTTHKPPREQEPIFNAPSYIVTPHVPYIPQESFGELRNRAAWNAIRMLRDERPKDLVN